MIGKKSASPADLWTQSQHEEVVTMDRVTLGNNKTTATAAVTTPTWETLELRRTIARTQKAVDSLDLASPDRERVNQWLDAASQQADVERPDRYEVGEHLAAVAAALKEAEVLAAAT